MRAILATPELCPDHDRRTILKAAGAAVIAAPAAAASLATADATSAKSVGAMRHAFTAPPLDAEIIALYRQWGQQQRRLQAASGTLDDDAYYVLVKGADELSERLAAIPAESAVGLAIKAYLMAHSEFMGKPDDFAAVNFPSEIAPFANATSDALARGLFADAARWLSVVEGADHA